MKNSLRRLLLEISYEQRNKMQEPTKHVALAAIDTMMMELFTSHVEALLEKCFAHCSSAMEATPERQGGNFHTPFYHSTYS